MKYPFGEIERKWQNYWDENKVNSTDLSDEEKNWIKNHPIIKLGFNPHMEPLLIKDKDGSISGIYPEIFSELEKVTGDEGAKPVIQKHKKEVSEILSETPYFDVDTEESYQQLINLS